MIIVIVSCFSSLEQLDSVCDELPTDGAVVHLLGAVPAELVAAQESCVPGFCQTYGTVGSRGGRVWWGSAWSHFWS